MMRPVGLFGVFEAIAGIGGVGDADAKLGNLTRLFGHQIDAKRHRVDDDEAVAAKGRVHRDRPEARHIERHREAGREGGKVLDIYPFGLAVRTVGPDPHQAARRLQHHLGHRLLHRDDAAVEQHRGHADGIRARHRRRILGLHDDPGGLRLGVAWRNQKVHMAKHPAAWFVQDEVAQHLVLRDPVPLLPDRRAGWRGDAADDDIADLAFGMARHDMNDLAAAHVPLPLGRPAATRPPGFKVCILDPKLLV